MWSIVKQDYIVIIFLSIFHVEREQTAVTLRIFNLTKLGRSVLIVFLFFFMKGEGIKEIELELFEWY